MNTYGHLQRTNVLPPFQIVSRFGFSRYIAFAMHLDTQFGMEGVHV